MKIKKHIIIFGAILLLVIATFYISQFFVKEFATVQEVSNVDKLRSLPYVSWVPIEEENKLKMGVTKFIPELSYAGINLYTSRPRNYAYLLDMHGEVLHTWSLDTNGWQDVIKDSRGNLFFLVKDEMLGKLDWDSNLVWKKKLRFHHWIALAKSGDIYSLSRDILKIRHNNQSIPILNDYITILSPEGIIKRKISIFKLFKRKVSEESFERIHREIKKRRWPVKVEHDAPFDIFHTNSVEIIDKTISNLCKKGDLLVSVRELNLVAIIDLDKEEIVWSWGEDDLDKQHAASFLENGNILIFDNGSLTRNYSRIIELNPIVKKIEWEYKAELPDSFYSGTRGSAQKLPNGNILITESNSGRVFEITRDGKIVWEFFNPDIQNGERAAIFRMIRSADQENYPRLKGLK